MVADDTRRLQGGLGSTDRRKLDEYLTAVREVERQVEMMEKQTAAKSRSPRPRIAKPDGIPLDFADHARLMFDSAGHRAADRHHAHFDLHAGARRQQPLLSRNRRSRGHHGLSHHRNDPALMDKVAPINRYHMDQFAYFHHQTENDEGWRRLAARSTRLWFTAAASATATGTITTICPCCSRAVPRVPHRAAREVTTKHAGVKPVPQYARCDGCSDRTSRRQPGPAQYLSDLT